MLELKNKRVLVVGLGKSGLAAAQFLKERGARVTVSDARPATLIAELPSLLEQGFSVEAGSHGLLTFRRQDLIVVSPGVPSSTPELVQVRALGMRIIGELELGAQYLQGEIIAITGSNGKTTTTSLVGEILKAAGRPTLVGGNIGRPVTAMVAESVALSNNPSGAEAPVLSAPQDGRAEARPLQSGTVWSVLEVSSFQLETIETFKPRIALVLNITPDHLDRHGSFEAYATAKARITENQTADDFLVLNGENKAAQMVAAKTKAQIYWFSARRPIKQGVFVHGESILFVAKEGAIAEPVMPVSEVPLAGAHNVENVLAAVCAARLAGVSSEVIRGAVKSFKAVEHRLEFVREVRGVKYYNDSKATNVDATEKAIAAFAGGVHVILGGKDKDSDYATLAPLLRERVKTVITIGSAAEKIERQLAGVVKIENAETLQRAVAKAEELAVAGDTVLLAPACASFDQFENYEHRGRVFKELVQAL
ncbi:UDP-N-acetylmuramoyl-L-alanine--D-glutamate ligase [Granulicella sp. 5B5]|uniref:UDP-N-acetylmuramoyl-L-alanine--D-glutamate ligase n=1 Tax=Granulicella sp. 5B5 TaxID=1617967 RepID=UPI0015F677E6|nr:UDP-N-acetylmuramoyl-L-alanine--D-glutamate ligase [Granulicella sp. 5B5]QMV20231.1 UDP-N-acetylmuramoyl-L-alanine--D-glutamate ligase [Granulicella sp. 5B5]